MLRVFLLFLLAVTVVVIAVVVVVVVAVSAGIVVVVGGGVVGVFTGVVGRWRGAREYKGVTIDDEEEEETKIFAFHTLVLGRGPIGLTRGRVVLSNVVFGSRHSKDDKQHSRQNMG